MGFQDQQWKTFATFDETQITSSVDRDPFIIIFKKIAAPAEILRWWWKAFWALCEGVASKLKLPSSPKSIFTPCNVLFACYHAKGSFSTTNPSNVSLKCSLVVCGAQETESNGIQTSFKWSISLRSWTKSITWPTIIYVMHWRYSWEIITWFCAKYLSANWWCRHRSTCLTIGHLYDGVCSCYQDQNAVSGL